MSAHLADFLTAFGKALFKGLVPFSLKLIYPAPGCSKGSCIPFGTVDGTGASLLRVMGLSIGTLV